MKSFSCCNSMTMIIINPQTNVPTMKTEYERHVVLLPYWNMTVVKPVQN